jgi:pilus assembly protein CpaF
VIELEPIFETGTDGRLARADGFPPHPDRFARAGVDVSGILSSGAATGTL